MDIVRKASSPPCSPGQVDLGSTRLRIPRTRQGKYRISTTKSEQMLVVDAQNEVVHLGGCPAQGRRPESTIPVDHQGQPNPVRAGPFPALALEVQNGNIATVWWRTRSLFSSCETDRRESPSRSRREESGQGSCCQKKAMSGLVDAVNWTLLCFPWIVDGPYAQAVSRPKSWVWSSKVPYSQAVHGIPSSYTANAQEDDEYCAGLGYHHVGLVVKSPFVDGVAPPHHRVFRVIFGFILGTLLTLMRMTPWKDPCAGPPMRCRDSSRRLAGAAPCSLCHGLPAVSHRLPRGLLHPRFLAASPLASWREPELGGHMFPRWCAGIPGCG